MICNVICHIIFIYQYDDIASVNPIRVRDEDFRTSFGRFRGDETALTGNNNPPEAILLCAL